MKTIRNILLVDDDKDDQEFFSIALDEYNKDILLQTEIDGYDALNYLNSCSTLPDLIFVDLNMPRVDGKEFLKKVQHLQAFANIPIIIYSTSSNEKDKQETFSLGAKHFITKPDRIDGIVHHLSHIIQ